MNEQHNTIHETAYILARGVEFVSKLIPDKNNILEYSKFKEVESLISENIEYRTFKFQNLSSDIWSILSTPSILSKIIKRYLPVFDATQACKIFFDAMKKPGRDKWFVRYEKVCLVVDYLEYLQDEYMQEIVITDGKIEVANQHKDAVLMLREFVCVLIQILEENNYGSFIPKQNVA